TTSPSSRWHRLTYINRLCPRIIGILRFLAPFGDITLWNILAFCVVIPYIAPYPRVTNPMLGGTYAPLPQRHYCWKEETAFISTPAMTVLARLLPDATRLRLEACEIDDTTAQITLRVCARQTSVPCPLCTTPTQRIHSHYERTLTDLPWAQYRVRLQLRVRKWFCRNRRCHRRIFTERLPTVAAPWARCTLRLAQRLVALGVALGGTAGVRLGHQW